MAKLPSLPKAQFTQLCQRLEQGLTQSARNFATAVQRLFIKEAATIAKCDQMQLEDLRKFVRPFGAGYRVMDMVDKAVLHGHGSMAAHVVASHIRSITFEALPKKDQRRLNRDAVIQVKQRNRVIGVRYSKLTERQYHQVISGNNPSWGILTPKQQVTLRRGITQQYYDVVAWRLDAKYGDVILTCKQGDSEFKARIKVQRFLAIAATLSSPHGGAKVKKK